jgi:HK97 family phage major capsid protein
MPTLKELHDKVATARAAQIAAIERAERENYSSGEAEEAYQRADTDLSAALAELEAAKNWQKRRDSLVGSGGVPHANGSDEDSQRSAFYAQLLSACAACDPSFVADSQRVLTTGSTGVPIPTFWEKTLVELRDNFTWVMGLANVVDVPAGVGAFKIANESALPTVSMVGENGSALAASDPTYKALIDVAPRDMLVNTDLSVQGQLRSMPMLDAQLQRQLARAEALKMEQQAIAGDASTNNCKGLQSWIASGQIIETTAAAFTGSAAVDKIKDTFDKLAEQYRVGARTAFVGTSTIMSLIRKLKDSVNRYYWTVGEWNPDLRKYNPGVLLDRPAMESAYAVHAVGASAKPNLIFGDFEYFHLYKWASTGLLIDPYTKRLQLLVNFSRHATMDVVVTNTDAFAGLRFTA